MEEQLGNLIQVIYWMSSPFFVKLIRFYGVIITLWIILNSEKNCGYYTNLKYFSLIRLFSSKYGVS